MPGKVAIVEVAQLSGQESGELYLEQIYRVCKEVLDKAGLTRNDIGTVVSAASDAFHGGVSCANAYFRDFRRRAIEERVANRRRVSHDLPLRGHAGRHRLV